MDSLDTSEIEKVKSAAPTLKKRKGLKHPTWIWKQVELDKIEDIDETIKSFIKENDVLHRLDLDVASWNPDLIPFFAQVNPLFIEQKSSAKYVAIGSGRTLQLLRSANQKSVHAFVCEEKLSKQQKLAIFCADSIWIKSVHKTKKGGSKALFELFHSLQADGLAVLREPADKAKFVTATGFSLKGVPPFAS